jgi:DNA polymerase-3 subunit gamma/tau
VARAKGKSSDGPPPPRPVPSEVGGDGYMVVARRYRPQRFEDVIGQDHVVQSLRNAIRLNKVTHAYLFSGTRGVGKTSIARIFAKCLNCVRGPTEEPCQVCDICRAISVGQDVDVIEIDGASNNGVEAVRELRQNAGLRPSRARYKIYYIDEVHMLSTAAFNALLKTLEEPPEHVKFFFATTEPNKIPITVLSRCQRYDFAGITPELIVSSLAEICEREGIEADRDALQVIARRAGGSMRDAQSLLEQLLASGSRHLTVDLAFQTLGIAPDERILELIEALAEHEPAAALRKLDAAVAVGVQPADLLNGLLEFLRDVMVLAAGAEETLVSASPSQRTRLQGIAQRWPLETILAALQILAEARGRMRGSPHGRLLAELALVRVAKLEDLTELSDLVARLTALEAGRPAAPAAPLVKKKPAGADEPAARPALPPSGPPYPIPAAPRGREQETAFPHQAEGSQSRPSPRVRQGSARKNAETATPAGDGETPPLTLESVLAAWEAMLEQVGGDLKWRLSQVRPTAITEPNILVIVLPSGYNWVAERCDTPEARARIEAALRKVLGRPLTFRFEKSSEAVAPAPAPAPPDTDGWVDEPLVKKVRELFEARRVLVDADELDPE